MSNSGVVDTKIKPLSSRTWDFKREVLRLVDPYGYNSSGGAFYLPSASRVHQCHMTEKLLSTPLKPKYTVTLCFVKVSFCFTCVFISEAFILQCDPFCHIGRVDTGTGNLYFFTGFSQYHGQQNTMGNRVSIWKFKSGKIFGFVLNKCYYELRWLAELTVRLKRAYLIQWSVHNWVVKNFSECLHLRWNFSILWSVQSLGVNLKVCIPQICSKGKRGAALRVCQRPSLTSTDVSLLEGHSFLHWYRFSALPQRVKKLPERGE